MAQQSSIARLNGTYRTAGTYRGQTGTPLPASTHQRLFLGGRDRGHRGRRAVVLTSTFPAIIADGSARRRWPADRAASARPRVCGRDAAARRAQAPARGRYLPSRSLKIPLVMPAIPTSGLAQSRGIILAIRIIRPRGVLSPNARVSGPHVPNVGITGTVHNRPVILLLGHRSTGHTTPTGPMIRLSPAGQMVCAATRPFTALERGVPGVSPGPRKARPGG